MQLEHASSGFGGSLGLFGKVDTTAIGFLASCMAHTYASMLPGMCYAGGCEELALTIPHARSQGRQAVDDSRVAGSLQRVHVSCAYWFPSWSGAYHLALGLPVLVSCGLSQHTSIS